jgi:hypothetical protein
MAKYRSITGVPVRIASTSGHVIMVPPDRFVSVPSRLERLARAEGCMSEDLFNAAKLVIKQDADGETVPLKDAISASGSCIPEITDVVNSAKVQPPAPDTPGVNDRQTKIVDAIRAIDELLRQGADPNSLLTSVGKYRIDAVVKYSGLDDVSRDDVIDAEVALHNG